MKNENKRGLMLSCEYEMSDLIEMSIERKISFEILNFATRCRRDLIGRLNEN